MSILLASWLVWSVLGYLAVGLVFGLVFVFALVQRVDPAAKGSGVAFRLLILPGVAALWPLVLLRVLRGNVPVERNAHRTRPLEARR